MNRGICDLPCVPLRGKPDSAGEMTSMLLFGETFSILSAENGWTRIITDYDGYEGWISTRQACILKEEPSVSVVTARFPLTFCTHRNEHLFLLPGSTLPSYSNKQFHINDKIYELAQPAEEGNAGGLETITRSFLNAPYLWGGRSLFGIDCSGFTQVTYKILGVKLKRDAWQQAEQGETVAFRASAQAGDLAFFDNAEGRIIHVGIMLSADEIIHASGKVRIDSIDDHGIMNREEQQYSHKLRIIKRVL